MTQPDAFLQSARERADEKDMRVELYLVKQIRLSALALNRVSSSSDGNDANSIAMASDVQELTSASERLQNVAEVKYEA
jgi:hypothetical protein